MFAFNSDDIANMSVNGIGKSAISRIKGKSWNTINRWLQQAFLFAKQFNSLVLQGYEINELQADEIRTFVGSKTRVRWLITALEVSTRLWVGKVFGRRSYKNVKTCLLDVLRRGHLNKRFLFTTDGFNFYRWVALKYFKDNCIYGQVIKKRRKNRITSIRRSLIIGHQKELDHALLNSEDSETLNTSFVERHNLTIRLGSSYLGRRTACHARESIALEEHLELLQLHYNFIRPHLALKFGKEIRTPAMQAGLVRQKLSFRDIFSKRLYLFLLLDWVYAFLAWNFIERGDFRFLGLRVNNT